MSEILICLLVNIRFREFQIQIKFNFPKIMDMNVPGRQHPPHQEGKNHNLNRRTLMQHEAA